MRRSPARVAQTPRHGGTTRTVAIGGACRRRKARPRSPSGSSTSRQADVRRETSMRMESGAGVLCRSGSLPSCDSGPRCSDTSRWSSSRIAGAQPARGTSTMGRARCQGIPCTQHVEHSHETVTTRATSECATGQALAASTIAAIVRAAHDWRIDGTARCPWRCDQRRQTSPSSATRTPQTQPSLRLPVKGRPTA